MSCICCIYVGKAFMNHMLVVPFVIHCKKKNFFFLQDNNGIIGLLEPMKKCTLPVKVPIDTPVVKIVSGEVSACLL